MFQKFSSPRVLFASADYRRVWAIGGLSGVARWLEFVALAIFAYELTHSPELVALLAVFRMLPYVLLGFVTGALADTIDRKRLLGGSLIVMVLSSATMTVLTATGIAGYDAVAVATMISGAFWTIDMPVRRRLLVDAAGAGSIGAALGFDNSTMYATRALGPLIGGATYQFLGIEGIYALIASSYFVCIILTSRLGEGGPPSPAVGPMRIGLHLLIPPGALILNRQFQIILGVTLVYNLWCWPFVMMVPVIAQRDFGLPPALVGALSACEGIGGAIGALLVGVVSSERTLFRFYYLGTFAFITLMLALALHLTPVTAVAILLVIGMASAAFSATQYALVYTLSPPEMRGRATGVLSLFIGSSMLGHYHTGLLFERLGSSQAMMVMAFEGAIVMVILGVLWWRAPTPNRP